MDIESHKLRMKSNVNSIKFLGTLTVDCNTISCFVMTISPQKALIVGTLCTGLSGWLTIHLFTNSPNLNANDIGYLSTILEKTEKVQSSKRSQDLHLIVQGQSDPFISSSIEYPQAYDQSTLANLTSGAKIRIGYNKNKLKTTFYLDNVFI
jgi:hypothetical protein